MALSNPRQKGDNHLYFEVHDHIVKDSGTDMNNQSNQSGDVRDQSVQQGNGQVRRVKSKQGRSASRPTNIKHNAYSNAYVSPYIQEAEYRAQERTRKHTEDAKKNKPKPGWNSETSPRGNLFDPTLQKQEIFKLGPRKVASDSSRNAMNDNQAVLPDHSHTGTKHRDDDEVRVGRVDPSMRPKLTMRASAVRLQCQTQFDSAWPLYFCSGQYPYRTIHILINTFNTTIVGIVCSTTSTQCAGQQRQREQQS